MSMFSKCGLHVACLVFSLLILSGCDQVSLPKALQSDEADCPSDQICGAAATDRVRSIKPFVVTQLATGSERKFSGEIVAANSAPLSFAVGGRVETIDVAEGDTVARNALLATLDSAPFEINVQTAQADLNAAQAAERALRTDLERQRELQKSGWISQAALDQAEVEYEGTSSQVSIAQSRLTLAQRDLAATRMTAPFGGVIASVDVDPFTEVGPGQPVVVLQSGDAFEVVVSVPDTAISQLTPGAPVSINVTTLPLCGCLGTIIEIGAVSSTGNAVDIVVAVTQAPDTLRAGMPAEVSMTLGDGSEATGYFVPLAALTPGTEENSAAVFRFDPNEGVVRKTPVSFAGSVAAEAVAVEGLNAGDIIAAAGVSFLRDGQTVRVLGQDQ